MLRASAPIVLAIAVTVGVVPAEAGTTLAEKATVALGMLDEVAVVIAILAVCLLVDKASWSVLTGQKSPRDPAFSDRKGIRRTHGIRPDS